MVHLTPQLQMSTLGKGDVTCRHLEHGSAEELKHPRTAIAQEVLFTQTPTSPKEIATPKRQLGEKPPLPGGDQAPSEAHHVGATRGY